MILTRMTYDNPNPIQMPGTFPIRVSPPALTNNTEIKRTGRIRSPEKTDQRPKPPPTNQTKPGKRHRFRNSSRS